MITAFNDLNQEETDLMIKVPVLVAILIAGADDNIDKSEINKAIQLSKTKQLTARLDLMEFYQEVARDFEDKLKISIQQYPVNAEERNPLIIAELEKVNDILPKLERKYAVKFVESMKDLARKVAGASGGVLGYLSVGYEESKLINLEMIKLPVG